MIESQRLMQVPGSTLVLPVWDPREETRKNNEARLKELYAKDQAVFEALANKKKVIGRISVRAYYADSAGNVSYGLYFYGGGFIPVPGKPLSVAIGLAAKLIHRQVENGAKYVRRDGGANLRPIRPGLAYQAFDRDVVNGMIQYGAKYGTDFEMLRRYADRTKDVRLTKRIDQSELRYLEKSLKCYFDQRNLDRYNELKDRLAASAVVARSDDDETSGARMA